MKINQTKLLKVNDIANRNSEMLKIREPRKGDEYFNLMQVDTNNDRFMVAENLRPSLHIVDKQVFVKTSNDRELSKRAKSSYNNNLKQLFIETILSFKAPKFNIVLNVA
jgi:hypothetical protein